MTSKEARYVAIISLQEALDKEIKEYDKHAKKAIELSKKITDMLKTND